MQFDIIIVGSGVVGASLALALAKNTSLNIAILDAQSSFPPWQPDNIDHRVSAISLASQHLFQHLNVWNKMYLKRITPYFKMHVSEELSDAQLDFDCRTVNTDSLGYIIEDSVIRTSLHEAFKDYSHLHFIHPVILTSIETQKEHVTLKTQDTHYTAKLLIAADGASSWVRDQMRFELKTQDYEQTAIVATVGTTLSHEATARQRFLASGPLAFLPLHEEKLSSIVWSIDPSSAKLLLAQDDEEFCDSLTKAFDSQLGAVTSVSPRHAFPLIMRHAVNYIKPGVALIGDAAHTIHPLAGQGVNMGLLDATSLAEVILDALDKDRDYTSFSTLRRYERWRRSENMTMLSAVTGLKHLFGSKNTFVTGARGVGLRLTQQLSPLKNFFINYALGRGGNIPALSLRNE